jgi:hypothetical protein
MNPSLNIEFSFQELDAVLFVRGEIWDDEGNVIGYDPAEVFEKKIAEAQGKRVARVRAACEGKTAAMESPYTDPSEVPGWYGKMCAQLAESAVQNILSANVRDQGSAPSTNSAEERK